MSPLSSPCSSRRRARARRSAAGSTSTEEEIYLDVDGSATVNVNASVPALVALRGADLPVDPLARLDRDDVRAFFSGPGAEVTRVSLSRRAGRRFVHVSIDVADVRRLPKVPPFAWSTLSARSAGRRAGVRAGGGRRSRQGRGRRGVAGGRGGAVPRARAQRDPVPQLAERRRARQHPGMGPAAGRAGWRGLHWRWSSRWSPNRFSIRRCCCLAEPSSPPAWHSRPRSGCSSGREGGPT